MTSRIQLVLGSQSASRRSVLENFEIPFIQLFSDIPEVPEPNETPESYVVRLSREKARAVALLVDRSLLDDYEDIWIIGSDQTAVCGQTIYEKPQNIEDLKRFFTAFSGQTIRYLSGLTLYSVRYGCEQNGLFESRTHMKSYTCDEIHLYAQADPLFITAASGLRMSGPGGLLIDSIETQDPFALVGMPIYLLDRFCRHWGKSLFSFSTDRYITNKIQNTSMI